VSTPVLDKKSLSVMTKKTLDKLEKCRVVARKAWLDFVIVSQRYAIKTQILLTKLQGMQESFILILQDHLRKIIVVESSFLANQQYDIQMLFKVMEDIDVREDMRQFILKNANTPLDLYESDDEDDDEDGDEGMQSAGDRDRDRGDSADRGDEEDHDVQIVVDHVGKVLSTTKRVKSTDLCIHENKNEIWGNSPWTSDIFSSFFSQQAAAGVKLHHIKDLPLPPCEDPMTFSLLKSILIEKHLDELDKDSSSSSSSSSLSPLHQHQYLSMEKARDLSRVSLVSRHIDKHNSLVGEGQAGSTLAKLEITSSTQKKRPATARGAAPATPPRQSSSCSVSDTPLDDLLIHPLAASEGQLGSPLSHVDPSLQHCSDRIESREGVAGCDEEDDEEELMSYGTAEEALEKMVVLQTRMRQYWAEFIKDFSEEKGDVDASTSNTAADADNEKKEATVKGSGEVGAGVDGSVLSESNSSSDSLQSLNNGENSNNSSALSSNNQSSEGLDQLNDGASGLLSRNLKDAENANIENVDSVKCRDIMNSFGLLDAVSIDVDDNWHGERRSQEGGEATLSSLNMSPQSVQDLHMSTPVSRSKPPHSRDGLSLPFLSTTKSDYSGASSGLSADPYSKVAALTSSVTTPSFTFTDQTPPEEGGGETYSVNHFGSATPESLDFLTS
jgi:hypothetical protein